MLLNVDYITPSELTGYTRAGLADLPLNRFALAQWLPNRDVDDLEFRFNRGGEGLLEAASYRAFDTESQVGSRPGKVRVTGELPPISRKIRLSEYDRLRQRKLDEAIRGELMSDSLRMMRAVAARIELARGEALANGSIVLNENGMIGTIDFGRDAGHTTTAATVWSDTATATILTDLLAWRNTYIATNDGEEPGALLTSNLVIPHMLRNAEFRALAGTTAGTPSVITRPLLNEILAAHGLPPIYEYNAQVKVNGASKRVIPSDRVLFLPAPVDPADVEGTDLGASLWGTTAESLSPRFELTEEEAPGIVAGVYETQDPVSLWTKAAAIAVPILANPNLSFSADVL